MKEIKLSQGKVALVDDEDFEWLNQYKWYAHKGTTTFYAVRSVILENGKKILLSMHRFILGITDGKIEVDHEDHDGLNNQRYNLRACSHAQNHANAQAHKNTTSKYVGVCYDKSNKKWLATIRVNYKKIHIGRYLTEEEAAIAFNKRAVELKKEFAYINKIA